MDVTFLIQLFASQIHVLIWAHVRCNLIVCYHLFYYLQILSMTQYLCHCQWGYAGDRCQIATPCLSNGCKNGGQCIPYSNGTFECKCVHGYYGVQCELEEDGKNVIICNINDVY